MLDKGPGAEGTQRVWIRRVIHQNPCPVWFDGEPFQIGVASFLAGHQSQRIDARLRNREANRDIDSAESLRAVPFGEPRIYIASNRRRDWSAIGQIRLEQPGPVAFRNCQYRNSDVVVDVAESEWVASVARGRLEHRYSPRKLGLFCLEGRVAISGAAIQQRDLAGKAGVRSDQTRVVRIAARIGVNDRGRQRGERQGASELQLGDIGGDRHGRDDEIRG